jgi:hypothetical protein
VSKRIGDCKSIQELLDIYKMYPQFKETLKSEYETQKRRILINDQVSNQLLNQKTIQNGIE